MALAINEDVVKGKWKQFKGQLQKTWGKITDDQWEQTKGEATKIAGLVQEKYGVSKEEAEDRLNTLYNEMATTDTSPDQRRL